MANSIGALASTKLTANTEFWKHESGFPLLEDYTIVIVRRRLWNVRLRKSRHSTWPWQTASITGSYALAHSGEIELGGKTSPEYVRMEALYTFPNGSNTMTIIFPRAQVTSSVELDMQKEDNVASPVTIEAKRADSAVSGGNAVWDSKPYGRIAFA